MAQRQYKFFDSTMEVKAVDGDEGIIEGYAGRFNNVDQGLDVIRPGAFKKTIEQSKGGVWPVLNHHDPRHKIGFNLEAKEDDNGLWIREKLNLETVGGRDQFALSKMAHEVGGKDGLSIGFISIKEQPLEENQAIRELTEIKMMEHSHVTFGMNTEAFTTAVKQWQSGQKDLGLGDHIDLFFKAMEEIGFKHSEVIEALSEKKAADVSEPDDKLVHSCDLLLKQLKGESA